MRLEASSVPVVTLKLTSDVMTPSDLWKLAFIRIRSLLVTVPGAVVPQPYGGMDSFVMISLSQQQLQAHHLSAMDVQNALDRSALLPEKWIPAILQPWRPARQEHQLLQRQKVFLVIRMLHRLNSFNKILLNI